MKRLCSYNKVLKARGRQSALMDGTPITIGEPVLEPSFDTSVEFRGNIDVIEEESGRIITVHFSEIAEDFSPSFMDKISPLNFVARSE